MSETERIDQMPRPTLRIGLLGGFHIDRVGPAVGDVWWERRGAKTLVKLLATHPRHCLHREHIMEVLWPAVDLESALNSFGKALHAARRALEPELPPRTDSAYLRLRDSILVLRTEHVVIDADRFQQLAEDALRSQDVTAHESALAAYGGELLPEDRYEDWCAERRQLLAELHVRLLLGLAEVLEENGSYDASADRLREVLDADPTREDVHRRLMRLYAQAGSREQAIRQFLCCRQVLRRELELSPQQETLLLYQDILEDRIETRRPSREPARGPISSQPSDGGVPDGGSPFIGRESALRRLRTLLDRPDGRGAGMVVVSGEAGVGKTRLLEEFASDAKAHGASVLWGGTAARCNPLAYGPFAIALEGFAASRPEAERKELAERYPALARFVPSLAIGREPPASAADPREDHLQFLLAVVRLLTALGSTQPVVLVVGDLHDADPVSLDLLRYLAHFAVQRRWLLIGAVRDEEGEAGTELGRMIDASVREGLCLKLDLPCLARPDCDQLVQELLSRCAVSEELLEQIFAQSRGNPLFVEELLEEMRERSELVLTAGCWHQASNVAAAVPARIRAVAATQLSSADDTVRRILTLAAAGPDAAISLSELLAGAAALDPSIPADALFEGLDRAIRMRILEAHDDGYGFRQPLIHQALYEQLSMHRRQQLRDTLRRSHGTAPRALRVTARG